MSQINGLSLPVQVQTFLKWLELTTGRDKVYRLVAYFSKYVVQVMKDNDLSPDWRDRLSKGSSAIGQTRKLIRFFRSVEYMQEFLKSLGIKDDLERYLALSKSFSFFIWMVCDHVQWMQKAGYLKLAKETMTKVDEYHSKGWFFGLLAGLILCALKLKSAAEGLQSARKTFRAAADNAASDKARKEIATHDTNKNKQMMGIIKNAIDIVIPAARLNWLPVSDGTVGLAGTVTSLIGIYDTWPVSK